MATKKKKQIVKKSSHKNRTAKKKATSKRAVVKKTAKKKPTKTVAKSAQPQSSPAITLTTNEQKFLQYHHTLKLQIELVPRSCWWSNVRSNVTDKQWDNIRKPVYQKANFLCEICRERGTKYPVECHEVWIYDDTSLTQRLGFFQALCPLCHEVKHIGLAGVRGNGERAFNRFKIINQLSDSARQIKSAVFTQWGIKNNNNGNLTLNI